MIFRRITLRDTPRQIAAIALVLVSLFFSYLLALIAWSLIFRHENTPYKASDALVIVIVGIPAYVTGWMAHRIIRKRRSTDGKTYLGPHFIIGFGIFFWVMTAVVIIAAPDGLYYLPCAVLPLAFIASGLSLLRRK